MKDTDRSANLAAKSPERPWQSLLPPPIVMMGVPFDPLTTQSTVDIACQMVESGDPHILATANIDFLALVQEDKLLQQILVDADLILCDGTPLVWMSKLLGDPLPERVAGSDMVPLLLDMAQQKGYRVFFLGGSEEVADLARLRIEERWPDLAIAGFYSPPFAPFDEMDHEGICRRIRDAQADMLFVSFGCPKQEKWLAMNYRQTGAKLGVGVGATIDFLAGTMKRAPVWMRRAGLEWLFRMLQEPRRLMGRYWRDFRVVVPGLLRQMMHMRGAKPIRDRQTGALPKQSTPDQPLPQESSSAHFQTIVLPERLDMLSARDESLWPAVSAPWILLDASATNFMDSTGTGKIVRFSRAAREAGGACVLIGARPAVLKALDLMRLRSVFREAASLEEAQKMIKS